jgi:translation initiation factor 1 (eIF-1/SUI1)
MSDFSFLEDDPKPDDGTIRINTSSRPRRRREKSIVEQLDSMQRSLDATGNQMLRFGCSMALLGGLGLFVLWLLIL